MFNIGLLHITKLDGLVCMETDPPIDKLSQLVTCQNFIIRAGTLHVWEYFKDLACTSILLFCYRF